MGKTFREISDGSIVEDLRRAYADERLAEYLYYHLAETVGGELYPQLREMLEETAKAEAEHAGDLADMIIKLGGELIPDPMTLEDMANDPVIIPPAKVDLNVVCDILAEAEGNAIRVYKAIADKTKDTNHSIYALVVHILSEEINHEELFENLKKV